MAAETTAIGFSIVTAVRNRSATISYTIASLMAQSYARVQHVVIDGASTDGTLDVLRRDLSADAVLISENDSGIYCALNKGIALCTGDVIGVLHSDDVYAAPDVLTVVAQVFEDPCVHAVYGDLDYVATTDPNRVVRRWRSRAFVPGLLKKGWMPPHPTLFVRRELVESVGSFDTRYRVAADYDFILRCFALPGIRVDYIPRVLVRMRVGGASNGSLRRMWSKSREDLEILRRHRIGGLGTLLRKNLGKLSQWY